MLVGRGEIRVISVSPWVSLGTSRQRAMYVFDGLRRARIRGQAMLASSSRSCGSRAGSRGWGYWLGLMAYWHKPLRARAPGMIRRAMFKSARAWLVAPSASSCVWQSPREIRVAAPTKQSR
jgi:hypothetical protein